MMRLNSIVRVAFAVLVAAISLSPGAVANAAVDSASSSLSIAPKKTYVVEPGKSVKDKLTIRNLDNNSDLQLTLRVVDFTFTDEGGTPKLFLAPDAPQTTWSLKPFLNVPKTAVIPAGGTKSLDMNVAVPAGHGAGSYYSAIVYSSGVPDASGNGNVGLSASGVTLVFTQIPGKVDEKLTLEKLGAYIDKSGYKLFTAQEPLKVGYTLKNSGNVTESPSGSITLTDLFGRKTQITDVNPSGSLALIGQTRTFTPCIKTKDQDVNFSGQKTEAKTCVSAGLWPGYYSVAIDLFYGQNGNITQEITGKSWFVYMPLWFVIVLVLAILIATYYIRKLVRRIKGKRSGGVKLGRAPKRRH